MFSDSDPEDGLCTVVDSQRQAFLSDRSSHPMPSPKPVGRGQSEECLSPFSRSVPWQTRIDSDMDAACAPKARSVESSNACASKVAGPSKAGSIVKTMPADSKAGQTIAPVTAAEPAKAAVHAAPKDEDLASALTSAASALVQQPKIVGGKNDPRLLSLQPNGTLKWLPICRT